MNEITKTEQVQEFELMQRMGKLFFASGLFSDLKSEAQAIVKVMIGKEMGIAPFASMSGIHLIGPENGPKKPAPSSNLMATLVANHPHYSYRIKRCDKDICVISFYESKDKRVNEDSYLGDSVYTIQEAQQAELLGRGTWKKFPSDMLFARALSRGARRFTPGIFGGSVMYTPDELGVEMDEDGVIEMPKTQHIPDKVVMKEVIEEIKEARADRDGIIPQKSIPNSDKEWIAKELHRKSESEKRLAALNNDPIPGSDEAIIEEIKKTHAISDGGF